MNANAGYKLSVRYGVQGIYHRLEDVLPDTLFVCWQVSLVTDALEEGVVSLIRDLNGNHVIQRCLQRLGPEESQFVYDAAAANTMDIATHRHGCCVLQRCIDFATPAQKRRVVDKISEHALPLSQASARCSCTCNQHGENVAVLSSGQLVPMPYPWHKVVDKST